MNPFALAALVVVALSAVLLGGAYLWLDGQAVDIGLHGWIALSLGAVLSLALGAGLMALVFHSHRTHDHLVDHGAGDGALPLEDERR